MNQSAIYIFSPSLGFSGVNDLTNSLSDSDKRFFNTTLLLNIMENASSRKGKTDLFLILPKNEVNLELESINHFHLMITDQITLRVLLLENITKELNTHKYNIFIAGNVVDIRPSDIDKYLNLLGIDEKTILLSKSSTDAISVFGFCGYTESLIKFFIESELSIQKFLSFNKSCEYYITMIKDVFAVKDLNDFKKLYADLSLKSSLEYCSHEIHERFTHLFVEYKDLLK